MGFCFLMKKKNTHYTPHMHCVCKRDARHTRPNLDDNMPQSCPCAEGKARVVASRAVPKICRNTYHGSLTTECSRKYVFRNLLLHNCPEGKISGKFLKKRAKLYFIEDTIFSKVAVNFVCLIGLQRTEHLSEAERLCKGLQQQKRRTHGGLSGLEMCR